MSFQRAAKEDASAPACPRQLLGQSPEGVVVQASEGFEEGFSFNISKL